MNAARITALFLLCLATAQGATKGQVPPDLMAAKGAVRVRVSGQAYDFLRPWLKKAPSTREGVGAVLPDRRVLVTAELVANHNYIEIEMASSGEKSPAKVVALDYDANLALLEAPNSPVLKQIEPVDLAPDPDFGDQLYITQFEASGLPLRTPLTLTTVEISPYPISDLPLLVYRLSGTLQPREGSFTTPLLYKNKLAGIVVRYDGRSQNSEAIPLPVISRFLKYAGQDPSPGFPRAGLTFAPTRDPQLRKYLGLQNGNGVLVTAVEPGGAAAAAGIKAGDTILSVAGKPVDQDGNYDDARYGKLSFAHQITTLSQPNTQIPAKLFREGKTLEVQITPKTRSLSDYISPPYLLGVQPRYFALGGIVFQELSRQYLREWGTGWERRAPERLVYYDRLQFDILPADQGKVVFVSQILPSPATIGYDQVAQPVVTKVNGKPIHKLEDVEAAAASPESGFHKIELEQEPRMLILDAEQVRTLDPAIQRRYGLTKLKSF